VDIDRITARDLKAVTDSEMRVKGADAGSEASVVLDV